MTTRWALLVTLAGAGCTGPLEFGGWLAPCDEDALATAMNEAGQMPADERADAIASALRASCPLDPALDAWVQRWASADTAPPPPVLQQAWQPLCEGAPACDPLSVWSGLSQAEVAAATSPEDALLAAVIGRGLARRGTRPSVVEGLPRALAGVSDRLWLPRGILADLGPAPPSLPTAPTAGSARSACSPWRPEAGAPQACGESLLVLAAPDAAAVDLIGHHAVTPNRYLVTAAPDARGDPWEPLGVIPYVATPGGAVTGPTLRVGTEHAVLWTEERPRYPAHEHGSESLVAALSALAEGAEIVVALGPSVTVQHFVDIAVAADGRPVRVAPATGIAWPHVPPIPSNNQYNALKPHDDPRASIRAAGEALGDWGVSLAGRDIDGRFLTELASARPNEPFLRVVREARPGPGPMQGAVYMNEHAYMCIRPPK